MTTLDEQVSKVPHAWIQWKGTNVCADIWCSCASDEPMHIDADFAYFVRCGKCGKVWKMGAHVQLLETDPKEVESAHPSCVIEST